MYCDFGGGFSAGGYTAGGLGTCPAFGPCGMTQGYLNEKYNYKSYE